MVERNKMFKTFNLRRYQKGGIIHSKNVPHACHSSKWLL